MRAENPRRLEQYADELEAEIRRLRGLLEKADIMILDLREDLRKAMNKAPQTLRRGW